jgi:hypothetical protein
MFLRNIYKKLQVQKKIAIGLKANRGTHTTSFHLQYITFSSAIFFGFKTFSNENIFLLFFLKKEIPGLPLKLRRLTRMA